MSSTQSYNVCWFSLDPVKCVIDFYTRTIAKKLEFNYMNRNQRGNETLFLGNDCFNATANFKPDGSCFQTTEGFNLGRCGYKQPGYREIKRVVLLEDQVDIKNFVNQKHGEWRFCNSYNYIKSLHEIIPTSKIATIDTEINNLETDIVDDINPWTSENLNLVADTNTEIIVWQWCRGEHSYHNNVISLSDEWWVPYTCEINTKMETDFKNKELTTEIQLINETAMRHIEFTNGSYAKQYNSDKTCMRMVRRVIKTISELKYTFDNLNNTSESIDAIISNLPDGVVPSQFYCPITQCIMTDPVKTIDNHIYDSHAILRWFQENDTSPLTGLHLLNTTLKQDHVLRTQIADFISLKTQEASTVDKTLIENPEVHQNK